MPRIAIKQACPHCDWHAKVVVADLSETSLEEARERVRQDMRAHDCRALTTATALDKLGYASC